MNKRLQLAAQRRRHLVAECDAQRTQLALQLRPLEHTLASVDTGLRIVGRIHRHPEWLAAGAIGLMMLTPRRLSGLMRAGSQALRTWRAMAPQLQMLAGRFL